MSATIDFSIQAIPDGVWWEQGNRQWCRLSLLMTPAKGELASVESFPKAVIDSILLDAEWRIDGERLSDEALSDVRVHIPTANGLRRESLAALRRTGGSSTLNPWRARAVEEWNRIFNLQAIGHDNVPFETLLDVLDQQAQGADLASAMDSDGSGAVALRIEGKHWEGLGSVADFVAAKMHELLAQRAHGLNAVSSDSAPRRTLFWDTMAWMFQAQSFAPEDDSTQRDGALLGLGRSVPAKLLDHMRKELDQSRKVTAHRAMTVRFRMQALQEMHRALQRDAANAAGDRIGVQEALDAHTVALDKLVELERESREAGLAGIKSSDIRDKLDRIAMGEPDEKLVSRVHRELARAELASRAAPAPHGVAARTLGESDDEKSKPVTARLSAIAALPRFAQYLGLLIDVDLPARLLTDIGDAKPRSALNSIAVTVPGSSYRTETFYEKNGDFFGPAELDESMHRAEAACKGMPLSQRAASVNAKRKPDQPLYRRGFVNLRRRWDNTDARRFSLRQTADELSTVGMKSGLSGYRDEVESRERSDQVSLEPPAGLTPGLTLVDRQVAAQTGRAASIAAALEIFSAGEMQLTLDSLVAGMRFDIGVVTDPFAKEADIVIDWYAACGRSLRFDDSYEQWLDGARLADEYPLAPRATDRDEAAIMTVLELKTDPWSEKDEETSGDGSDGEKKPVQVSAAVRSELQTYAGRPLGLPAKPQRLSVSAWDGLVLNQTVGPPRARDLSTGDGRDARAQFPALRFGRGYLVSARVVYENHGGLSWREAYRRYYSKANTLEAANKMLYLAGAKGADNPDDSVTPLIFRRVEPIAPPKPLLFDRLSRRPDFAEDAAEELEENANAGAQMRVLIHRREDGEARPAMRRRVLAPPRISRELALLHDVFRAHHGDAPPPGAFARLRLNPETGDFITTGEEDVAAGEKTEPTGDSIARPRRWGEGPQPQTPYYPDPMAQLLCVMLVPIGASVLQQQQDWPIAAVPFYPASLNEPILDRAVAHLVEVMPSEAGIPRLIVDSWAQRPWAWRGAVDKRIRVELPPGREYDLVCWSAPWAAMQGNPAARARILRTAPEGEEQSDQVFRMLGGDTQNTDDLVDGVLAAVEAQRAGTEAPVKVALPIGRSISAERLRVVHASAHPARPPNFKSPPVLVRLAPPEDSDATDQPRDEGLDELWAQYVADRNAAGEAPPTPQAWKSERGGRAAALAGAISVDLPSTAAVSVWAEWEEPPYAAQHVKADENGGAARYACFPTMRRERLARIDGLPHPTALGAADAESVFHLHRSTDGSEVVARAYDFDDDRARKLTLVLSASSRFRALYPDRDPEPADPKKPWETVFSVVSSDTRDFLLPATRRPSAPRVTHVGAVASAATPQLSGRDTLVHHKHWGARVWLGEEWYSSGVGEMLAVVCRPDSLFSKAPDLFADPKTDSSLTRYLTTWGADPIIASGALPRVIPPWRFVGADDLVSKAQLPTPVRKDDQAAELARHDVSASLYQPHCDPVSGEFFCDLVLDPGDNYAPFVKLGLARYNPNTLNGLEMSTPSEREIVHQIKPARTVQVTRRYREEEDGVVYFDVVVNGVGYWGKDVGAAVADEEEVNFPRMRLRFFSTTSTTRSGHLAPAEFQTADSIKPIGEHVVGPSLGRRRGARGGPMTWTFESAKLPKDPGDSTHYMIFLEEISIFSADDSDEPSERERDRFSGSQRTDLSEEKIRVDLLFDAHA